MIKKIICGNRLKWIFSENLFRKNSSTEAFSHVTAQKMNLFMKDFFSKCEQIRNKLRVCSHLLKKSLMENYIFYSVRNAVITNFLSQYDHCLCDSDTQNCHYHSYFNGTVSITRDKYIRKKLTYSEPIDKPTKKFRFHPSILVVKSKIRRSSSFFFRKVEADDADKEIHTSNSKKAGTQN